MKRVFSIFVISFILFGLTATSRATLIDNSNGTITQIRDNATYGDGSTLMWLKDANFASTSGYCSNSANCFLSTGVMTWDQANDWITYLNTTDFDLDSITGYANYSDWRLPQTLPVNGVSYNNNYRYDGSTDVGYNIFSPSSEMAYMYYVELENIGYCDTSGNCPQSGWGLSNTGPFDNLLSWYYWSGTEYDSLNSRVFVFEYGRQEKDYKESEMYAWAVRPVPEPGTWLLLGSGIIVMACMEKRRKRDS
ncbi:MAG: DUF1566 domain-containing protein [Nitrospirae bacterium]|nr:DUF1566 domain-containing protein [Nitrospirota bacterium]